MLCIEQSGSEYCPVAGFPESVVGYKFYDLLGKDGFLKYVL